MFMGRATSWGLSETLEMAGHRPGIVLGDECFYILHAGLACEGIEERATGGKAVWSSISGPLDRKDAL